MRSHSRQGSGTDGKVISETGELSIRVDDSQDYVTDASLKAVSDKYESSITTSNERLEVDPNFDYVSNLLASKAVQRSISSNRSSVDIGDGYGVLDGDMQPPANLPITHPLARDDSNEPRQTSEESVSTLNIQTVYTPPPISPVKAAAPADSQEMDDPDSPGKGCFSCITNCLSTLFSRRKSKIDPPEFELKSIGIDRDAPSNPSLASGGLTRR